MPVRPPSVRRTQGAFVALTFAALAFAALTGACASRAVPAQFPPTSATSLAAPEARPACVTSSLEADPPLPGHETEHWPGLRPAPSAAPAHGGHHGH